MGDLLDLWISEIEVPCVEGAKKKGILDGVNMLIGDQSNPSDLNRWISESGGNFSVIVDDGGHRTVHIINSFNTLWPNLAPGGLYFIEDLQVQRALWNEKPPIADIITNWVDQLLVRQGSHKFENNNLSPSMKDMRSIYPVPKGLKW
eukprot:CAMPEP_0182422492 /NCGR_PEP_ID=MMETSP1167-20130531/8221_1 /TAXON_ID=2988 /ORGANISM="Mallomonas Sp, Strain CCMP3275" /LENGTH=146 /DNA_ID=CAMNT_0024600621 /DNA_START=462 /DNA_END=899 /DNA_ORIENTATION=-